MKLTDINIRKAKPREKAYKLSDGGGLYIQIEPTGGKLWRYKYRFERKEKTLYLGRYLAAREWFQLWKTDKAESHYDKVIGRLEKDAFPYLGNRPITEISAPEVLAVLRRIENRGVFETARRVKENISQVMRYAIATGRADRDPCPDLRGALKPATVKHMPTLTEPKQVEELLRAIDGYK